MLRCFRFGVVCLMIVCLYFGLLISCVFGVCWLLVVGWFCVCGLLVCLCEMLGDLVLVG